MFCALHTRRVSQTYAYCILCDYRFHLGSIALGSFIIAVIQFIRAVLEYVDRQMKTANPGNVVLKYLMACARYVGHAPSVFVAIHVDTM